MPEFTSETARMAGVKSGQARRDAAEAGSTLRLIEALAARRLAPGHVTLLEGVVARARRGGLK